MVGREPCSTRVQHSTQPRPFQRVTADELRTCSILGEPWGLLALLTQQYDLNLTVGNSTPFVLELDRGFSKSSRALGSAFCTILTQVRRHAIPLCSEKLQHRVIIQMSWRFPGEFVRRRVAFPFNFELVMHFIVWPYAINGMPNIILRTRALFISLILICESPYSLFAASLCVLTFFDGCS